MSGPTARIAAALGACLDAADPPASGLCVALSGGLDSSLLLAAIARSRAAARWPPLRAIHVHHGLHPDAGTWSRHCSGLAARLDVSIDLLTIDARPGPGDSPEASARDARYAVLAGALRPGEMLLTAHHADDQLEGILLQWLRGGGLRAVAGMPALRRFGRGWHARPLLGFTRDELATLAREAGLDWIEDPSNRDTRFDRNYVRHSVLPAIRARWPAAARTVGRVAAQAAEALAMEQEIAAADLGLVEEGASIVLDRLELLPGPRRRWVLRRWLRTLCLPVPAEATLAALEHDAGRAAPDRVPCTRWSGVRVHRYRGRLYAESEVLAAAPLPTGVWTPGTTFALGPLGSLELRATSGQGLAAARVAAGLEVVGRPDGGTFRPAGSVHRRPLRKWMQERGVLPWRRTQLPLVACRGEIVAIADFAVAEGWAAAPGEPGWVVAWNGRPCVTESDVGEVKPGATEGEPYD